MLHALIVEPCRGSEGSKLQRRAQVASNFETREGMKIWDASYRSMGRMDNAIPSGPNLTRLSLLHCPRRPYHSPGRTGYNPENLSQTTKSKVRTYLLTGDLSQWIAYSATKFVSALSHYDQLSEDDVVSAYAYIKLQGLKLLKGRGGQCVCY
ncbi:hypothetical protein FA15DRAFT_669120 [Coprinopsis marcescibilis]|uniref:Uncharacterized protein n=1 Tax=Coprinopsis marcescibilis TaxID=230819 RepID=A0A5C3KWL7_COPMA|nr:hypothetical protein FA15DRAFT_669120 [Coprinopsis marcescibilis]